MILKKILLSLGFLCAFSVQAAPRHRHPTRKPAAVAPTGSPVLRHIQELEDQRASNNKFLLSSLNSSSRPVVRAAILALGRIGDPAALEGLASYLNKKDKEWKRLAAFSLGLIGGDIAYKLLTQQSQMIKDSDSLEVLLPSVGRTGNESTVSFFEGWLKRETSPAILESAARGLGILWAGSTEKWVASPELLLKLTSLSTQPEPVARSAAFALSRYKGNPNALPAAELSEAVIKTPSDYARALLCRVLARVKSPLAEAVLIRELMGNASLGVRVESALALGGQNPSDTSLAVLKLKLFDANPGVVISSLEALAQWGTAASLASESVEKLLKTSSSLWVRGTALKALAKINPSLARPKILEGLTNPHNPLLPAAVAALGLLGTSQDMDLVVSLVGNSDVKVSGQALDVLNQIVEDRFNDSQKSELKKALATGDSALVADTALLVQKHRWKDFAPLLISTYRKIHSRDGIEAKVSLINAMGSLGDPSAVSLLASLLNDPDRLVVEAAVSSLKLITNKEVGGQVPLNSRSSTPTPPANEIRAAVNAGVVLKTTRGDIHLRLLEDAPLTAAHFVQLVRQGFYNGKNFHRVVPNFVIQGGDPRGDGYGGPGYFIRDEVSLISHDRGIVGLATAGKDTGGSQFFINLAPNLHLDGRYTAFARVTRGMEIVDRIEPYDQILTAKIE